MDVGGKRSGALEDWINKWRRKSIILLKRHFLHRSTKTDYLLTIGDREVVVLRKGADKILL